MKNKDKKMYFKHIELQRKLESLNHDQKVELNKMLDQMDAAETEEEKEVLKNQISQFVDNNYQSLLDASVCDTCISKNNCYRQSKGKKSCGHYESEEENND